MTVGGRHLETLQIRTISPQRIERARRTRPGRAPSPEMVERYRERGAHDPLLVRPVRRSRRFTLVAGEEYLDAALDAGLRRVPVVVIDATIEELRAISFGDVDVAAATLRDLRRLGYLIVDDGDLDGDEIEELCDELMPNARDVSEVWCP